MIPSLFIYYFNFTGCNILRTLATFKIRMSYVFEKHFPKTYRHLHVKFFYKCLSTFSGFFKNKKQYFYENGKIKTKPLETG